MSDDPYRGLDPDYADRLYRHAVAAFDAASREEPGDQADVDHRDDCPRPRPVRRSLGPRADGVALWRLDCRTCGATRLFNGSIPADEWDARQPVSPGDAQRRARDARIAEVAGRRDAGGHKVTPGRQAVTRADVLRKRAELTSESGGPPSIRALASALHVDPHTVRRRLDEAD